jgi:diaminohydroxyphosphoribosylaminopyrimidine deaminase / 5-amino-6-(5-phosphoribosylamino)uracil reductase
VAGGGFAFLRERGVVVETDVEHAAAARQNAPFVTWMKRHRPHTTMKVAVSRDGFAGAEHTAVKLTGPWMDRVMHRQRAGVDAIAVGSTTILVDDPQLTARLVFRQRPLTRVVFDRRGRVTASARLFQTLAAGPVIMFVGGDVADSASARALGDAGAIVVPVPKPDAVTFGVRYLAERDVQSLLVEGGPTLHRAFWDAGVIDRVQVIETPAVIGRGVRAFLPDFAPERLERRMHGPDALMEWDVHRPD